MRRQAGFTLIEVLIVLFIISIVTSVALLTISHNENRQVESFANELVQTLTLAEEQAMLQPSVLGLSLGERTFQFSAFQSNEKTKKQTWMPFADKLLGQHVVPDSIQVEVKVDGKAAVASSREGENEAAKGLPQIVISTNGDVTPFTIYVGKKGQKPRYAIRGEADGNVTKQILFE